MPVHMISPVARIATLVHVSAATGHFATSHGPVGHLVHVEQDLKGRVRGPPTYSYRGHPQRRLRSLSNIWLSIDKGWSCLFELAPLVNDCEMSESGWIGCDRRDSAQFAEHRRVW